ncbi:hypothetical protein DSO57_1033518 [Entomophthora muscae]|uniref:Uncharacterized protein n=1 Tax=Entomophthora muscae TaxID=34485 RepID=A0ACC2TB16_9FUNG|nr:hypothetical protein DSO57_1033518 [Entomophthora muscae]
MSSFNNNQVNKLFPSLDEIMQGYARSLNSEASVYDHSQPTGPSASVTQETVLSPATSRMALFAHHAQAAANPNPLSAMASGTSHFSHGVTQRAQNPKTTNQMALTSSQDGHVPPPANQPTRRRRKLITPDIVLKMVEKREKLMPLREIADAPGPGTSSVGTPQHLHQQKNSEFMDAQSCGCC